MGTQSEYKNDFKKYIEKEKSVIELINYTGKLLYERGVELVFFRRHLIDVNITEILRLHHYAKNFVKKPISVFETSKMTEELYKLKLCSSKIDIGSYENQTLGDFLESKKMSNYFINFHIIPMVAAIWSMPLDLAEKIDYTISIISKCFKNKNKLIIFGNGGSAADAQHIAAEFIGRFRHERESLPAIALPTDTSTLSSIGNDYSFDIIFSRQCESIVKKGDVVKIVESKPISKLKTWEVIDK